MVLTSKPHESHITRQRAKTKICPPKRVNSCLTPRVSVRRICRAQTLSESLSVCIPGAAACRLIVHGRPHLARLSFTGGSQEEIAPVHSDFCCGTLAAVHDGFCWTAPVRLHALEVHRLNWVLPSTV